MKNNSLISIAVIGCGRVGRAVAALLVKCGIYGKDIKLVLVDSDEKALKSTVEYLKPLSTITPIEIRTDSDLFLENSLRMEKIDAIVCSTPFTANVKLSQLAYKLKAHYIDFTEDVNVTNTISLLAQDASTVFAPQCGLAPGIINVLGLELAGELKQCSDLEMRVGALSQIAFGPSFYSTTWSTEGLINEYRNDAWVIQDGKLVKVKSLEDCEQIIFNGTLYECFNTSGGMGVPAMYKNIKNVNYKTLRYPGHLNYIKQEFNLEDFEGSVKKAKKVFSKTRNDLVILIARAKSSKNNEEISKGLIYYPSEELGLTALELTTAAGGLAVLELIFEGIINPGLCIPTNYAPKDFWNTSAMRYLEKVRNAAILRK